MKRFNSIRSTVGRLTWIWRGHVAGAETPSPLPKTDRAGVAQGIMVAALCLLVIIIGVGGLLAIRQISHLTRRSSKWTNFSRR